jgi:PKD domain
VKRSAAFHFLLVPALLFPAVLLTGCGGGSPAPTGSIPPATTTLQSETGNNTSAANSFTRQTNGNAGAGNVSKLPISSLLYSGSNTKIYVAWQGWFGQSSHMDVGYNSDSATEVHAQVEDMISRGVQGAIADWYGPASTVTDAATMLLKNEAETHSGQFEFAIAEDGGALSSAAKSSGCDVTDQIISDLTDAASQYESSPAYMRTSGRPVVFFFGVDSYYIDWNRVISTIPGNPLLIFRGTNGLTRTLSDGGFSWVNIQSTNAFDPELNLQDSFYQAAQQAPQRLAFGSAFKGFNDTLAAWSTDRVIDQDCGQTWLQSFSEAGKFYSSGNQLPAMQIVTWNDYEEGTAIEPGIDNCVYLVPSQSGGTISWTVNGNENTIDHYTVFASTDGKNLSDLADVPRGTHSIDLSKMNLSAATTYSIYVKAIGLPSIQNKMSPPIAYHAGDQPPAILLNVSQTGDLTYSASTSGSSGSVAKSAIDFGDGTVVNGASASHTYSAVGTYLITATAYDSAGASSVAVQQISAKPASGGITIVSPGSNATVNWPTTLIASANPGTSVSAMRVLIDGREAYALHGDTINTALKVFTGTHQISVQSLDGSGNLIGTTSLNVIAEPNDVSPVAKIMVTAMPSISPTTVLGCTATSSDPDGFLIGQETQYSNGSNFSTAAALETFAAPGTYTATATVTDQFGATGTTSTTFSIAGGSVSGVTTSGTQSHAGQLHRTLPEPLRPPQE